MRLCYFIIAALAGFAIAAPVPGNPPPCPLNNEPDPTVSLGIRSLNGGDPKKCKSS
jgi:hypothetical protein